MNLLQLEYFLKLAELGSFRATAEALYVSQPAVSKQISLLEKEWGFDLFERGYRYANLTESGQIMLEVLRKSEMEFNDTLSLAKIKSKQFASQLTLGVPEYADVGNLSDIIAEFQREHPKLVLQVKYVPMSMLSLTNPSDHFDLIINYERNVKNLSNVSTYKLSRCRHMAIISKEHAVVRDITNPKFEDLQKCRVYVPAPANSDPSVTRNYCIFICNNHGFSPMDIEMLPNVESVLMAVKMGFGYAVLDDLISLPERYDLMRIPSKVSFDLLLAWNKTNKNPAVTELARKIYEELDIGGSSKQMEQVS